MRQKVFFRYGLEMVEWDQEWLRCTANDQTKIRIPLQFLSLSEID